MINCGVEALGSSCTFPGVQVMHAQDDMLDVHVKAFQREVRLSCLHDIFRACPILL